MSEIITLSELAELNNTDPRKTRERKKISREIAAIGKYDSNKEIENQVRRRHSVGSMDQVNKRGASDSFPYSTPKHRKANINKPRDKSYATVAIQYKLRDASLYWWGHSIAVMANHYSRGNITRGEWREFVDSVKAMA